MYQVSFLRYGARFIHTTTDNLADALRFALDLDSALNFGDDGISYIDDTNTGRRAMVGNGHYTRNNNTLVWR